MSGNTDHSSYANVSQVQETTYSKDHKERVRDRRRRRRQIKREKIRLAKLDDSLGTTEAQPPNTEYIGLSRTARKRRARNCISYDISAVTFSECWYAQIQIGDILVDALVDSGAEMSLLSTDIYQQLPDIQDYELRATNTRFRGIGGAQQSLGTCHTDISVGPTCFPATFHVVKLPGIDCILGMDTLKRQDMSFHLSRGTFTFADGSEFALVRHAKKTSTKVCTASAKTVKANTACFVQALLPAGLTDIEKSHEGLVEPLQTVYDSTGLIISCSMVTKQSNRCPVYVINPTNSDIELQKGTQLATFSLTEEPESPGTTRFDKIYDIWRCAHETNVMTTSVDPKNEDCLEYKLTDPATESVPGCDRLPPHLAQMFKNHQLKNDELQRGVDLIWDYRDIFLGPGEKLGLTNTCEGHEIDTGDAKPVRQRLRRLPPKRKAIVEEFIQDLLNQRCIRPSNSEWASPIVIVSKKDGSPRLCIDYRKVNAITRKDAFPLPRIDDTLDQLSGMQYFCTFDLAAGYFQLPMAEKDTHKSAFITHMGLYEWLVLPMGLTNSPATFQRCMSSLLNGLIDRSCLVYLDDIISFGKTFDSTIQNLKLVFDRLRQANLKLKPKKCKVFQRSVEYLGHIVSPDGLRTDPKKILAVQDWPTPKTVRDVRSFLGLASYYRKFIPNFSSIAHPLTRLTEKNTKFSWSEHCQVAFDRLKLLLTSSPVLSYPKDSGTYIVDTDASLHGIGAVLSQIQDGDERVIAYASKSLSRTQRRYCTTKRELLAVIQFVTVTFRNYLAPEDEFIIRTDHASLVWLMNFKEAEGLIGRWFQLLSDFHFKIQHRKGSKHGNADALSRAPPRKCARSDCPECRPTLDFQQNSILAYMEYITPPEPPTEINGVHTFATVAAADTVSDGTRLNAPMGWSHDDLISDQRQDHDICALLRLKEAYSSSKPPNTVLASHTKDVKLFCTKWDEFTIINGVLYRENTADSMQLRYVVPQHRRPQVLSYLHRNPAAGHLGVNRTTRAAVRRFYWPRMRTDVLRYIKCCLRCEMAKPGPGKGKTRLHQEISGARNERVAFDIIGPLPETPAGNKYILTVGDYFSKYFIAVPLKRHTAEEVSHAIVKEWICKLGGCPLTIHSDRAPEFCGKVMRHMFEVLQIHHTKTLPYRPQSDGMVERFNGTIQQMLRCSLGSQRNTWDEILPFLVMAYNATEQASTGCSPNLLCFGEELVMPVDLLYGSKADKRPWIRPDGSTNYFDFVEHKRKLLVNAFSSARTVLRQSAVRQARGFNIHLKEHQFLEGDWVLKWYKPAADRKLGRGWIGPYVVTKVISQVAYELQAHPKLRPKVVHVDYLKKCHAWADKDNWVRNPDYVCPPGRPRKDPDEHLDDIEDILSDQGDLDTTPGDINDSDPELDSEENPVPDSNSQDFCPGDQTRAPHPAVSSGGPVSPAYAPASGRLVPVDGPAHASTSSMDLPRDVSPMSKTRKSRNRDDTVRPGPSPVKTRKGRTIRPPDRYTA